MQRVGIFDVVVVVVVDQPLVVGVGLVELARGGAQLGPHPVREHLLVIQHERRGCERYSGFVVAPFEG